MCVVCVTSNWPTETNKVFDKKKENSTNYLGSDWLDIQFHNLQNL